MTAARIDKRPRCAACGGHEVEEIGWIAYRPDGTCYVVSSECPHADTWCHACEADVAIVHPERQSADYRRAQRNDAAREAGPELLAACRSAADVLAREGADGLRLALEALRQAIARAEGGKA